jgi:multiple sugar transport system ATP-binding protein
MAKVILKNISKIFDNNVNAVQHVNLEISDGEFMVFVGPSGCGKSTTLRMIAGLEEISEGEIYINDKCVNDLPSKDRDIAMVFQNYALYPHMTVFENMAFGLKLRKFSKGEIKNRVEEAAKILGLTDLLDRRPKKLSGGQRQRVAVGRAIVRKPKVFLFDEPLSNLDAKLRVQMRLEISKLHNELDTTMIYVTHDQVEAMTMGDRITVMKDGLVHQVDSPTNLYNKPVNKFVAGFIGSPSMNFFDGHLEKNGELYFQSDPIVFMFSDKLAAKLNSYSGNNVILGIRPEDFSLNQQDEKKQGKINAQIELIEPLGNENFLYLETNKHHFIMRTISSVKHKIKDNIDIYFALDKIHFFDSKNSTALL